MKKFLYKIPIRLVVSAQKGSRPLVINNKPAKDNIPYLDINALEEGEINQYTHKNLADTTDEQDLLVVWDGSRSGLVFKSKRGAVGSTLMRIRPFHISTDYMYYFIKSKFDYINMNTTGASIPHVDADLFFDLEIPYLDTEGQDYIVKIIKEKESKNSLFLKKQKDLMNDMLATANVKFDNNDDIEKSIKYFRQSVVEKAVKGDLTKEWRKNNDNEAWSNVVLGSILLEKPKNGYSPRPVSFPTQKKVLTLSATTTGNFDKDSFKYFDEPIDNNSEFWLKKGDILIQRGNSIEYVGVPAIYTGEDNEFIYPDLMIRVRPSKVVFRDYLLLLLSAESTRNYFRARATGSSGSMPKINQKTLIELPISLPSLEEQREILTITEELIQIGDKVLKQYKQSITDYNLLEKSIISELFEDNNLKRYTDVSESLQLIDKIQHERSIYEKEQSVKKKMKNDFINKSFIKFGDTASIKLKIKEILLEEYSSKELNI